jgi:hypothetical protein
MGAYYLHGGWKKSRMVDAPQPAGSAADAGLAPPAVVEADDHCPHRAAPAMRAA